MSAPPRLYLSPPHMCGRELDFVHEAFRTNWIAPAGPDLDAFEQEICRYPGVCGQRAPVGEHGPGPAGAGPHRPHPPGHEAQGGHRRPPLRPAADMAAIVEICARHEVPLIEDAAESLGATYKGRLTGTIGRFGWGCRRRVVSLFLRPAV